MRFCFGRRAGVRRSSALRFVCLAKVAVEELRRLSPVRQPTGLTVDFRAGEKPRKLVELPSEVKNLFLQIDHLAGA